MKRTLITFKGTDGQKRSYRELVRNAATHGINLALSKVDTDQEGWQRVLECGNELKRAIAEVIVAKTRGISSSNCFAAEEALSHYGYFSGYRQPVSIEQGIETLRSYWPQLNPDPALRYMREVYPKLQLPDWIEGPFLWIRPGFFSSNYGEEVEEIFKALAKAYKEKDKGFVNCLEGRLGAEDLRQYERTVTMLGQLVQQQPNSDLLVVPGNFGIRYPTSSIQHTIASARRAQEKFVANENEFGVGIRDGGTMLLTNPDRLQDCDDLWIDLSGDEHTWVANDDIYCVPYFSFDHGNLECKARHISHCMEGCASVSVFLPSTSV